MAITVFPDVILPNRVILAGVTGKQVRRNTRVTTQGGHQRVNIDWSQTLREYEIGIRPMLREQWQEIETLHEITEGGAYGFLIEDPKDSTVVGGVVASLGSNQFQLYKRYTEAASGRTKDRKITRPNATGFAITVDGVALTSGEFSLDTENGIVTIPANPDAADVRWSGRFYVPVHFQSDTIDWELVAAGPDPDSRFLTGPSCILEEVRE